MVMSCACMICNLTIPFLGKILYYASIKPRFKAGDYAQNYAGIIFSSLLCQSRAAMKGMYLPC